MSGCDKVAGATAGWCTGIAAAALSTGGAVIGVNGAAATDGAAAGGEFTGGEDESGRF